MDQRKTCRLVGFGLSVVLVSSLTPVSARSSAKTENPPPGPIITDRPTATASPVVVPPQTFQLEAGYLFSRSGGGSEATDVQELPDLLLRYGITSTVEIRLVAAGLTIQKGVDGELTGYSDIKIGTKIALADGSGARPQMGLLIDVTLPVGSREFSSGEVIPTVLFLGANNLSRHLDLTYNIGPSIITEERSGSKEINVDLNYTVALSRSVGGGVSLFAEFFGAIAFGSDRSGYLDFKAGTTILLSRRVQIDFRAGVGLSGDDPDWLVGAGFAFRIPR
jgi:hypothetical protein